LVKLGLHGEGGIGQIQCVFPIRFVFLGHDILQIKIISYSPLFFPISQAVSGFDCPNGGKKSGLLKIISQFGDIPGIDFGHLVNQFLIVIAFIDFMGSLFKMTEPSLHTDSVFNGFPILLKIFESPYKINSQLSLLIFQEIDLFSIQTEGMPMALHYEFMKGNIFGEFSVLKQITIHGYHSVPGIPDKGEFEKMSQRTQRMIESLNPSVVFTPGVKSQVGVSFTNSQKIEMSVFIGVGCVIVLLESLEDRGAGGLGNMDEQKTLSG
jgi:hypothetical protein